MAGEAKGIEMPVGAELRGKTSEQTRRTLMIVTALSSKTFIGLHCLLPQNGKKKQDLVLFIVWDFIRKDTHKQQQQ